LRLQQSAKQEKGVRKQAAQQQFSGLESYKEELIEQEKITYTIG
jgi:hypothetical protein